MKTDSGSGGKGERESARRMPAIEECKAVRKSSALPTGELGREMRREQERESARRTSASKECKSAQKDSAPPTGKMGRGMRGKRREARGECRPSKNANRCKKAARSRQGSAPTAQAGTEGTTGRERGVDVSGLQSPRAVGL